MCGEVRVCNQLCTSEAEEGLEGLYYILQNYSKVASHLTEDNILLWSDLGSELYGANCFYSLILAEKYS